MRGVTGIRIVALRRDMNLRRACSDESKSDECNARQRMVEQTAHRVVTRASPDCFNMIASHREVRLMKSAMLLRLLV